MLMNCVLRQKGLTQLHRLQYNICGVNLDVNLYRRLQRLGVIWQEMANDAKEEQGSFKTYSIVSPNQSEVLKGEIPEED